MANNPLDKAINFISPAWALKREQARRVLAYYESAKSSQYHKLRREWGSGDTAVLRAGTLLREQARHLEQNHDLALGALNVLVTNVVGAHGITVEPQPMNRDGTINIELARAIKSLWHDWCHKPEVTGLMSWAQTQRMACRTWVRDGEFLAQLVSGDLSTLDHRTKVPFSLELIEADLLPMIHNSWENPIITAGVERNAWGAPIAYHLYKQHPGDMYRLPIVTGQLKRVTADRILHPKQVTRFNQARGVSVFASVMSRLDDIKDYEESERIAAKVAASMAGYIKKGSPDMYDPSADGSARALKFQPGMVFDDLLPGEEIGTIDSKRPNPQLEPFRNGQLRAIAAGIGVNYSSLSRNYDGSYSSQRQELVEGWSQYQTIQGEFTDQFVRPVYKKFIEIAQLAGLILISPDLDPMQVSHAMYTGPQMPWIDPAKEANAWESLERNGLASGPEIIRRRGKNPQDVFDQERVWRQQWQDAGLVNGADPANDAGQPQTNQTMQGAP